MSKRFLAALTLLALLVPASSAMADIQTRQDFKVISSSSKAGTKKKPANIKLTVIPFLGPLAAGETNGVFSTKRARVYLDKNIVLGTKKFPGCALAVGTTDGAKCPANTKVGGGKAIGTALGQSQNIKVTAYNGAGGNTIFLKLFSAPGDPLWSGPLEVGQTLVGKLGPSDRPGFGRMLTFSLPTGLIAPADNIFATLLKFQVQIGGTGKGKTPYVGLAGCTKKKMHYGFTAEFTGVAALLPIANQTKDVTVPCK